MSVEEFRRLTEATLSAWNSQDVESVVSRYTEDCVYLDPNTRGPVVGRDAFRRYLSRLFERWQMHWSLREFFLFEGGSGGAFLWHATLTPASGGRTAEIDGMDLVMLRGDQLSRNEVYFDRTAVFSGG
jgi:ketosteroid isomerase-like protein